jgi:hypothetical protein
MFSEDADRLSISTSQSTVKATSINPGGGFYKTFYGCNLQKSGVALQWRNIICKHKAR